MFCRPFPITRYNPPVAGLLIWPVSEVQYKIDSPADAHIEQFPKYTDDDIHNLMAYLQTLK